MGTAHTERGFTYLGIDTSGHFLSMAAPEVSFRALEVLLGRVDGFDGPKPFSVDVGFTQGVAVAGDSTGSSGAGGSYGGATGHAMQANEGSSAGAAESVRKTSDAPTSLEVRGAGLLKGLFVFGLGFLAL